MENENELMNMMTLFDATTTAIKELSERTLKNDQALLKLVEALITKLVSLEDKISTLAEFHQATDRKEVN